jgi:hypothetical protein
MHQTVAPAPSEVLAAPVCLCAIQMQDSRERIRQMNLAKAEWTTIIKKEGKPPAVCAKSLELKLGHHASETLNLTPARKANHQPAHKQRIAAGHDPALIAVMPHAGSHPCR